MNQNENKVGRQNLKDHLLLKQTIRQNQNQNQNPTMTPTRMRIEPKHIGEKQKEYIK